MQQLFVITVGSIVISRQGAYLAPDWRFHRRLPDHQMYYRAIQRVLPIDRWDFKRRPVLYLL